MSSHADCRAKLLAWRRNLFDQVAEIEGDLLALTEQVDPEMVSEGQEENISRLLARLDDRGKAEIEAIDRALLRIEAGTYATCVDCDGPIPAARLAAVLTAETCLPCAKERERRTGA